MPRPRNTRPDTAFADFARADAAIALISPGGSGTAESSLLSRAQRENPPGLLSLSRFPALSGGLDLLYAQWTDDASCLRWLNDGDAPPARYALYRSYRTADPTSRPTLLATPRFACSGPGSQQRLADTIVETLTELAPPGLLGAHLHLSVDGSRVVNYAQWADETAWQAFVNGRATGRMRSAFAALHDITLLNTPQGVARYRIDGPQP
ncbi:hypothetical protein DUI70_0150 [Streptomyces albus]|nr:hypothetical protein DUI70_0150 [Streptomyces albus]